ncbi:MAG: LysR family transcriptional regulator [Treponema sp.]|nr:LysR family transcriptional regulator [Treponema sp.]
MDIHQIEYIVRLADTQSLTKTAEEMFISPSALSQHLSKLEKELGTTLFKRIKHEWPLTEAGKVYVEAARDIIKRFRQMKKDISDIAACESGVIHIGISSIKSSQMFARVFPKFNQRYPNIKLKLVDASARAVNMLAEQGLLDMAFSTTGFDHPGLAFQVLLNERFVLSVPKTHRLARLAKKTRKGKLATVDLCLFKDEPFILSSPDLTTRVATDKMFNEAGFIPTILFELNAKALYNLVESGCGISIIPMGNIRKNSASVYFLTNPLGEWDNIVAYAKASRLSRAEEYFITLAKEFFETEYGYLSSM